MQNLPQNKMPKRDLDIARRLVACGDMETLDLLFDNVPDVLSQLLRTAFVPAKGNRLIVADFSSIEARIISWLAGEEWRLDVFRTHGKIYEASAEQMFHLPPGSVGKSDPLRQHGKVAELALGFGGGANALIHMGALAIGLKESDLMPLVHRWRAANKAITKFWWDNDKAAKAALNTQAPSHLQHGICYKKQGAILRIKLPSGRELSYAKPMITNGDITYEGALPSSGNWSRLNVYGPKFAANIVRATARDCLAAAITQVEAAGHRIVFHVHDELVCEVPESKADTALKEVLDIMRQDLPWAEGLPLQGDGYTTEYYIKL